MTFYEAISLFENGKKIRRASWEEERFMVKSTFFKIGRHIDFNDLDADDWEVINDSTSSIQSVEP